jgi:hypothetical protein
MAISSGVNLQKLGIAATLFAKSFTFGGIIEEAIEEVPPFGAQVVVKAEEISLEPPQSFTQSAPWFSLHNPSSGFSADSARFTDTPNLPQSVVGQALLEEVAAEDPVAPSLVVSVEPLEQAQSFTQSLHEEVVAVVDPITSPLIVVAEPLKQPQSFTRAAPWLPAHDPAGGLSIALDDRIVQATLPQAVMRSTLLDVVVPEEPQAQSPIVAYDAPYSDASWIHSTFLADNVELDITRSIIVEAPRHPRTAISVVAGSFLADNVELDISRRIVVEAPRYPREAKSVVFGNIIPEIPEEPLHNRVIVEAKPVPTAGSITRGFIVPEIIPPGTVPEGQSIVSTIEGGIQDASVTLSGIVPDNVELDIQRRTIVSAEPLKGAHTFTRGFIVPELVPPGALPPGKSVFVRAEPIPEAYSTTLGANLREDINPELMRHVIAPAEPQVAAISVTSSGFVPLEAVPDEPVQNWILVTAERLPQVESFVLPSITPEPFKVARAVSITLEKLPEEAIQPVILSGIVPDDVVPPMPQHDQVTVIAEPISLPPRSTLFSGIVPPDFVPAPEHNRIIVQAEPISLPPDSYLIGTFLANNIELDITRQVIVQAHPISLPPLSTLQGTFLADEVFPTTVNSRQIVTVSLWNSEQTYKYSIFNSTQTTTI